MPLGRLFSGSKSIEDPEDPEEAAAVQAALAANEEVSDGEVVSKFDDPILHNDSYPGTQEEQANVALLRADLDKELAVIGDTMPEKTSDYKLLRFLRGNGDKVDRAAKAFRDMLRYREKHGLDDVRRDLVAYGKPYPYPWTDIEEFKPIKKYLVKGLRYILGRDKKNNIVTVIMLQYADLRKIHRQGLDDLYWRASMMIEEWFDIKLHDMSVEQNRLVSCYNLIDSQGVQMTQFVGSGLSMMRRVMELQKNYPESTAMLTSINVSWIALVCWNSFVSAIVPAHTKAKMKVLGKDYLNNFGEYDIAVNEMPEALKGEKRYPDFDSLYEGITVNVGRGSVEVVEEIIEGSGTITWWTVIESSSAVISIEFVPSSGESVIQLVAPNTHDTSTGQVDGSWQAPGEGILRLKFDNSMAWIRSVTVEYKVTSSAKEIYT